ncbi:hypothetical protein Poli38472_007152 [Pythium oligandrum]|uniref:Nucleolar protein 14 n=1 Tax=Pythium oligandrum TaxID=41045 RepID=A0A8K1CAR8_PYTOL|nr:hypothetical protein Poli38472_007152 [Pythium oligandrum]|eukprot:TMW59007.1 hypothetical protein Poli38472_007152 [Pythium oligandrum]
MFMKKGGGKKVSGKAPGKKPGVKPSSASKSRGVNPFDVRSNAKTKYEVLGRRVKGQGRNVAVARSEAEKKRKKTLSEQFKSRNKANAFKDRRLGEADASMSLEDKMMARFQTERKRKLRNAQAFALHDSDNDDDDEEELFLTHKGEKIDDYDKLNGGDGSAFDDEGADDDETRKMDREIIEKLHFGGGKGDGAAGDDDGPERKKTHKEIMQEVMMKSKLFKAERQKTKAAQEDATDALDSEFAALKDLLSFRPTKGSKEAKELEKEERAAQPMDEFDRLTRELTFEAKAQASERRMTPEEQAKREHDRLEELERKRVARMNGEDDSDDEEGRGKGKKNKKKAPQMIIMPPTDDDLATGYEVDQRFGAVGGEEEEGEGEEDEEEEEGDEDDEEEEDSDAEEDGDEEDDDEDAELHEEEEEEPQEDEDEGDDSADAKKKRAERRKAAAAELPFVFPCPETPEDLQALFQQYAHQSSENRVLILDRLVTYYSPRLSADNQQKMRRFIPILLRQFLKFAKQYAIHKPELDAIAKHLFTLAQDLSDHTGVVVRELLINLHKRLNSTKTPTRWPQLSELLLFKALIQVFPTSDLRHNVISPLETLLGEALVQGTFETPAEVTQALVTCTLVLDITREKQRFTPEVLVCLKKVLRAFVPTSTGESHWLHEDLSEWLQSNKKDAELPALSLAGASSASAASLFSGLLGVLELAVKQYSFLPSLDELFYPHYLVLHELSRRVFDGQHTRVNTVITTIHEHLEKCWSAREPLRLQTFGPSVLPSFAPKFDANYTLRKDKTMDRDKAKLKQLQRQVKRARKGAARELRRDAEFLAREKQEEENSRIAAKREKQKEIWAWLEEQNATFNQQAKKGGNMLKGGGSGPAKKRRVSTKQK